MDIKDLENRFNFHPANTEEKRNEHTSIRVACLDLAERLNLKVPEGREKALAITKLEEVMFWANAGIARNSDPTLKEGEHMSPDHNMFRCGHLDCIRDAELAKDAGQRYEEKRHNR